MKMPEMFHNQGFIYGKSNPYEHIYELVESKFGWKVGVDQNGNEMMLLEVGEHAWDCCCSRCIDDDTVTEHLRWIDWHGRNHEWEVTHHKNWKYELVDKVGIGIPKLYPIPYLFNRYYGVEEE